jgi:isocitrate/isopropylmalate dehydrogenase
MAYKVTLLPGDGIGPEVAAATLRVIEATGVKIDWETLDAGEIAVKKYGSPLKARSPRRLARVFGALMSLSERVLTFTLISAPAGPLPESNRSTKISTLS